MEDGGTARTLASAAAALTLAAGILHLVLAQTHLEESRGQGLFFVGLGLAQVVWAVVYARLDTPRLWAFGLSVLATMPVVVYVLTRFLAAPFGEAEPVDIIGVATVAPEAAAALVLAIQGARRGLAWDRPAMGSGAVAAVLVLAGAVLGGALLGLGFATEGLDWLAEGEQHHHDEEAGHTHNATGTAGPLSHPLPSLPGVSAASTGSAEGLGALELHAPA